jgi:hypothetical protein
MTTRSPNLRLREHNTQFDKVAGKVVEATGQEWILKEFCAVEDTYNAESAFFIIDRALELGGSYYLTYHRWARKDQVLKAYPQMPEFLRLKKKYDPEERFQSDWYRHYREMFKNKLASARQ